MKPYRIVIAWNGDVFQGASMQEKEGEQFRFIPESIWPDLCATINLDALAVIELQKQVIAGMSATHDALKADFAAFRTSATQAAESALEIINDPEVDAERTVLAVSDIASEMLKPKWQRELEAANKLIADAIAARDKRFGAQTQ